MLARLIPAPMPQVDKVAMLRKKIHEIADNLVDELAPSLVGDKPLTMREISDLFTEIKPQLLGSLHTLRIADSNSSTRVCDGTQPDSTCNLATL